MQKFKTIQTLNEKLLGGALDDITTTVDDIVEIYSYIIKKTDIHKSLHNEFEKRMVTYITFLMASYTWSCDQVDVMDVKDKPIDFTIDALAAVMRLSTINTLVDISRISGEEAETLSIEKTYAEKLLKVKFTPDEIKTVINSLVSIAINFKHVAEFDYRGRFNVLRLILFVGNVKTSVIKILKNVSEHEDGLALIKQNIISINGLEEDEFFRNEQAEMILEDILNDK